MSPVLSPKRLTFLLACCGLATLAQAQAVWTPQNSTTPYGLAHVIWTQPTGPSAPVPQLVAVGRFTMTLVTSPDGVNWTERQHGNTGGAGAGFNGLAWVGNQAIALSWADARILTSPDGINWTIRLTGDADTTGCYPNSAAYTGSRIVVGCSGGMALTSPDGAVWTRRITGFDADLNSMTWTGSQLVAVGSAGAVLTSPDGISWTARSSGTTNTLLEIAGSGSQLVAVGENGTLLTSSNGIGWVARTTGTTNHLNSVTWTGHQWVAVGGDAVTYSQNNVVLTSPDGNVWTGRTLGTVDIIEGVTWTGNQLVAVGQFGKVWTSPENLTAIAPTRALKAESPQWVGSTLVVPVPDLMREGVPSATLYDSAGKKVRLIQGASAGQKTLQVPAGGLAAGIYYVEIKSATAWRVWPVSVSGLMP